MSTRRGILHGRGRPPVASDRRRHSELEARRGMLLIVVAGSMLAGAMVLVSGMASLQ
jgi:hypothetical protein